MTTKAIADYLEKGFWDDIGNPLDFGTSEPHNWSNSKSTISYDVSALSNHTQDLVHNAFARWDNIVDEDFKPVTGVADIDFETGGSNVTEVSYPGNNPTVIGNREILGSATVTLNGVNASDTNTTQTFTTILHEIGHALGLGHAGPYNAGGDQLPDGNDFADARFSDDSDQKSVMSYFEQNENPNVSADRASPITPQIADIQAIQSIYGLENNTRGGDTIYGYGAQQQYNARGAPLYNFDPAEWHGNNASFTIYDTGGTDTVKMDGAATDQRIDLRPGAFSNVGGGADVNNGGDTLEGNMTIAPGVEIENATGGTGDDTLIGNDLANRLFGHRGDDTMRGRGGDDTFRFGASFRTTLKSDTDSADTIRGGPGHDRLTFQNSGTTYDLKDATIRGVEELAFGRGYSDQTLVLTSAQMRGAGTDLSNVRIDNAKYGSLEIDMTGADLDLSGVSLANATPRPAASVGAYFATVDGDGTAETIETTRLADKVLAGGGNDTVRAGAGDDLVKAKGDAGLMGGPGTDTVDFSGATFADASIDLSAGNVYHDGWLQTVPRDPLRSDNPRIETLSDFENVRGATGGNTIRGDDGANELDGNGGDDELHANGGADTLTGGPGADAFVFEPETGPDNVVTDFSAGTDLLDLTAFDFESFSEVENATTAVKDGIEITLDTRTKTVKYLEEEPIEHIETKKVTVHDKVKLEGMAKADLDAGDVELADDTTLAAQVQTEDVFRFYNTNAGGHFYTASAAEAEHVRQTKPAFKDEGVGFEALDADSSKAPPEATEVFRFYNQDAGGHFYTASASEAAHVRKNLDNFVDEGVGFQAFDTQVDGTVPVYRFYNTEAGGHFYTASETEAEQVRNNLPSFQDEGVGFYAFADAIDLPDSLDLETLGLSPTGTDGVA